MTVPWRTGVVVMLKLVSSVEASMTEPVICYILDGILLLYCIITTALFFGAKLCKSSPEPKEDSTHAELQPGANADDLENLRTDQQSAATRRKRKQEASSDTYQALQKEDDGSDAYQVIMSKGRKEEKEASQRSRPGPLPPH
ncbi:T-cell surface glycoprotein CD3 zeta chain isoform X1 [Coregonus clupeaformis]|uniref:T-cell surface glycoprotein CD3 zeta chain isoform X1 n=2 Tax=Coregonus clupeaformis TaxID=59861 RepID=UPI001BDFABA2|nr:T-cell surface glycoprotein CD3 zeta chain isoform X1 [Coregonus clupeaformis]